MSMEPRISGQDLAAIPLFAGLPLEGLEAVAALAHGRSLSAGTRIFNQGDENIRAHMIIEGSARISQSGADGAQVVIRFIAAGEMFGTAALFAEGRYSADATTLAPVVEASWGEKDLIKLMAGYPQLAVNVIQMIGRRLQEVQDRLRELATMRAEQRVARTVLRLARQSGQVTGSGTAILFPLRRSDIAGVAGTTLYTVSRILTAWEAAGLLRSHRRQLTIQNHARLQSIADTAAE